MNWRALVLISCCITGACAGPVRTRYGALPLSGGDAPAQTPVSLSAVSLAAAGASDAARQAVTDALVAKGIRVDEHSPYELHIGLSARPDPVGIADVKGQALALPRKHRMLQSCRNNGYRLSLAVADRRNGMVVAHGWAEESHCTASLDAVLPILARQSVVMLVRPGAGSVLRWTQD